jgi:solute carrier family 13 (sodium-dependent dicarboxylate transporter), member 2/3/5
MSNLEYEFQTPQAIRVLCIENRFDVLAGLKHMLEAIGYEVVQAKNGEEALYMLRHESVDGVLLEYDLPDGTGTALRAELKQIRPNIPILLFAGVGIQTPFLLKFFDQYLRKEKTSS